MSKVHAGAFIHSLIPSFIRSFVHSFIRLSIRSFVHTRLKLFLIFLLAETNRQTNRQTDWQTETEKKKEMWEWVLFFLERNKKIGPGSRKRVQRRNQEKRKKQSKTKGKNGKETCSLYSRQTYHPKKGNIKLWAFCSLIHEEGRKMRWKWYEQTDGPNDLQIDQPTGRLTERAFL